MFWEHFWKILFYHLIGLAVVFAGVVAAARIRFSSPCWMKRTLDALFLLLLTIPMAGFDWMQRTLGLVFWTPYGIFLKTLAEWLPLLTLFYFAVVFSFRHVDRAALDSARMHGMGRCGTFWHVFFPAARGVLGLALVVGICRIGWCLGLLLAWHYR